MAQTPNQKPRKRFDRTLARRGGWAEALWAPAAIFGAVARSRAWLYTRRWLPVLRVSVPVISVGNLSVGGTGKTPLTAYLVDALNQRGWRPGVLSRGYGRAIGQVLNDEGRMLQARFPALLQVQNKDRVAGALQLLDQAAQVVVLDDGFQHRRLFRDLDVVLMDVTRPFGLPAGLDPAVDRPVRAPLPRGFLREGLSALRRADHVVLTRCSPGTEARVAWLCEEIRKVSAQLPIAITDHVASALWQDPSQPIACGPGWSEHEACAAWSASPVDLVSAIGNPEAFQRSVEALGIQVASHRKFPDHHDYTPADLAGLGERAWITTAKDHPKLLPHLDAQRSRPWVLDVRLSWLEGEARFLEAIEGVLPGPAQAPPPAEPRA